MNRPIDNDYISKERYYELKWFCRQYHQWEKEKSNLKISPVGKFDKNLPDPTGDLAVKLAGLEYKIETVDKCIKETSPGIEEWMKQCVVDGKGYNNLVGVPCCSEYFYQRYKTFFSRLNHCL